MRRTARFILLILFAGALPAVPACTSPSTEAPPAPAAKQLSRIEVAGLAQRIHGRINQERRKYGLPAMRWDDALGRIAGRHSRDMADKQYFGHISPEGHGFAHRYVKNGYACGVTVNGVLRRGAENIYRIVPAAGGDPAETAVRGWLGNRDDRKNLLSAPWEREGIGICTGPDGVLYITLNFC